MIINDPLLIVSVIVVAAAAALVLLYRHLYVTAQPDQWLLCVRDGQLKEAGIGIARFRRPGDVVVRFSSTMQRVRFSVEALSGDRVKVVVDGFILWSVSDAGESPFLAYRKLGLVELSAQEGDMRFRKHLLTTPQHRAFRQMVSAEAQRHAGTMGLHELLLHQDGLVQGLEARLAPLMESLGVKVDLVEIVQTRPLDDEVMEDLACEQVEAVRGEASRVRLEAAERTKQREIESETRLTREVANAKRDREAAEATAALELQERQVELLALQHAVEVSRQENDRDRRLLSLELGREIELREQAIAAELATVKEANEATLAIAHRERARQDMEAQLKNVCAEAEARRDAALLVTEAEEAKSPEVRRHEIHRLQVEKLTAAMASLPIKDARWVTIGDSPMSSLTGLIAGLQNSLSPSEKPAARPQ